MLIGLLIKLMTKLARRAAASKVRKRRYGR